ncbi:hypothetical protein PVAG01_08957 [Phlyctema vagabunda]|uniref:Uncharacterized protein n=1 Tax=Phlyctema vagabunda TaxID=108571 RepID=A0ABR4PAZ5_9HELO
MPTVSNSTSSSSPEVAGPTSLIPTSTTSAGNTTGAGGACAPAVIALASGIKANIADQRNELAAVNVIGDMLAEDPINPVTFAAAKSSLLDFVNKGIAIRQNNQQIAPAGNPAIPGLAIVANAQIEEFNLSSSLTGDLSIDTQTVATLKMDFAGGIEQNTKNLNAVGFLSTPS